MARSVIRRFLPLYIAFGLGAAIGGFVVSRFEGACDTQIVDLDVPGLTSATQAAMPAALTGSGQVTFTLDVTGIRVHADSVFENQTYDSRVLAVVRGSPLKLDVSAKLLRRILGI